MEHRNEDVTLPAEIHQKQNCGIFLNLDIGDKEGIPAPAEKCLRTWLVMILSALGPVLRFSLEILSIRSPEIVQAERH
jgi:hypothetical protein